jgi:hypothetical protein
MRQELVLLTNENAQQPESFFASKEEYEEFRRKFSDEVTPKLEHYREARQQSEAEAKQRWTR